jgi:hypothetical protein
MNQSEPKLTAKQEIAALSLAMGGRLAEAAAAAKVKERTVKAWHSTLPHFKRRIADLQHDMVNRAMAILADNAASAALTIATFAKEPMPPLTRLKSAFKLLELLLRYREQCDLAQRVKVLEDKKRSKPRTLPFGRTTA